MSNWHRSPERSWLCTAPASLSTECPTRTIRRGPGSARRIAHSALNLRSLPPATGIGSLSGREFEVLAAAATGVGRGAIAESLYISENTVKNHLVNIYAKLGIGNRMAAVALAIESGAL